MTTLFIIKFGSDRMKTGGGGEATHNVWPGSMQQFRKNLIYVRRTDDRRLRHDSSSSRAKNNSSQLSFAVVKVC